MRRALKWIGWILAVLIGLPLLLIAVALIGANTEPGRHLIERQLPKLTGGTVTIAGLSGRFPNSLRAARVEVRDKDGAWVTIENLAVDWRPLRLLAKEALFDRIAAEHVAVARLPVASAAGQTGGSQSTSGLPVSVTLKELRVARLDLAAPVAGTPAALALDGSAHLVSLEQGELALAAQRLDGGGTYNATGRIDPSSLDAKVVAREPAHGLLSGIAGLPIWGPCRSMRRCTALAMLSEPSSPWRPVRCRRTPTARWTSCMKPPT